MTDLKHKAEDQNLGLTLGELRYLVGLAFQLDLPDDAVIHVKTGWGAEPKVKEITFRSS